MDASTCSNSVPNLNNEKNRIELCSTILRELLGLYGNIDGRKVSAPSEEEERALLKKEMATFKRALRNINIVVEELESVELTMIKSSKKSSLSGTYDVGQELEKIQNRTDYRSILKKAKRFANRMDELICRHQVTMGEKDFGYTMPNTSTEVDSNNPVQKKIKELSDLCDLMSSRRFARQQAEKARSALNAYNTLQGLNKENHEHLIRNRHVFAVPDVTGLIPDYTVLPEHLLINGNPAVPIVPFDPLVQFLAAHSESLRLAQDPRMNGVANGLPVSRDCAFASVPPVLPTQECETGCSRPMTKKIVFRPTLFDVQTLLDATRRAENCREERSRDEIVVATMKNIHYLIKKVTEREMCNKEKKQSTRTPTISSKASKGDSGSSNPFGKFRNNKLPVRPYSENENQKKAPDRSKKDPAKKLPPNNEKPPSPCVPAAIPKSHKCIYEPEDYIPIDGRFKIVPHLERKRSGSYGMLPLPYIQFLPWKPIASPTYFDNVSPFRPVNGMVAKSYSQVFHRPPV